MPPLQQISQERTKGDLRSAKTEHILNISGAGEDRTRDLLNAIQALSQLSYGPRFFKNERSFSMNKTLYQSVQFLSIRTMIVNLV